MSSNQALTNSNVVIENLREEDLAAADHVFRLAFGTFMGLPDPMQFAAGADYVNTRWKTDPTAFFAAKINGQLVGTNFATNRGSVGFFGPLTIHPSFWDQGIGKRLMEPIIDCFARWETTHSGLFTFAQSQKHVGLYQRFGFWPRFLTAVMSKAVGQARRQSGWTAFSGVPGNQQDTLLRTCTDLTDRIYPGLGVTQEVRSVNRQTLG